ncbi:MAG: protein TolQ [Rickettsiales bacterium]|nr:protein TolQ [Rickettsiales bacterium]
MPADTAIPTVQSTKLAGTVDHDMSLIGLFMNADPIVMIIMLLLLLMSIISWGIIIEKSFLFRSLIYKTLKFEEEFWSAEALDKFHDTIKKRKKHHPIAAMFHAAMEEWGQSRRADKRPVGPTSDIRVGLRDRMAQMMSVTRNRELDKVESGMAFLSTAGSSAPFIGLLGTVIGIMNSFTSIAASQNTSLAVVAPGIAEALFATAIGLFVAIPSVIAFNKFSQDLERFAGRLDDFATEFQTLISRQIPEGGR